MTYTIAEPCIDVLDRACVDECPVDCIYEGPRMLYIQPDECVDCGACEPACPVTAIFYEDDVPAEWKQFTPINAEFFDANVSGLGSPEEQHRLVPRPSTTRSSPRGPRFDRSLGGRLPPRVAGDEHLERRSAPGAIFDPGSSAVELGEPPHEGEAHTHTR